MIGKLLDRLITQLARRGRIECRHCGTFNKAGTPCRCKGWEQSHD